MPSYTNLLEALEYTTMQEQGSGVSSLGLKV